MEKITTSTLPGAPAPSAFSGLLQARDGEVFAFARFPGRGCWLDVILRGSRERYPHETDLQMLKRDSIHVTVAINGAQVARAHFKRFSVVDDSRLIDPSAWSSYMTEVDGAHRRRGAGLALYGMMKASGFGVRPSTAMLSDGKALWRVLDPSITSFPSITTEPECDDAKLIERCAMQFARWIDVEERVRNCRSLADIQALGPESGPYLEAVERIRGWRWRDWSAPIVFARLGRCYDDRQIFQLLKSEGVPRWSIWSLRLLGRRAPGPARRLLQAYGAARAALEARDRSVSPQFYDYHESHRQWFSRLADIATHVPEITPASAPSPLVSAAPPGSPNQS